MASIANIVVNDSAATPVAHTYVPISTSPALWRETSASALSLAGQPTIKLVSRLDSAASGLNKLRLIVDIPSEAVLGTADDGYKAAPKVDYSTRAVVEFYLPSRSTLAQRKEARVRLSNLLLNAIIIDSVDNVAPPM